MSEPRYASQFGGLWPDRSDAADALAQRVKTGSITAKEADLLQFWMDNGYVILPKAVKSSVIDAALRDIDIMYEKGAGYVENYEAGTQIVQVEPRHRGILHKLLDAHGLTENLRAAVMSPAVTRFMNLIFDEPALAFQGLYF